MALLTNLISYWKLDEGSGALEDSHGTNDGSGEGGVVYGVAGKINTALDFDGTDDYVNVPDSASLSGLNPMSINLWIKTTDITAVSGIISKLTTDNFEWQIRNGGLERYLFFAIYDTSTGGYIGRESQDTVWQDGVWTMLTFTWDGGTASTGIKIYINGVSRVTVDISSGTFVNVEDKSAPIYIGRLTTYYIDAGIDEVGIWNKELSSVEVSSLYNGSAGLAYPFGEGGTNTKINIGDVFKDVSEIKINIGDAWKAVSKVQINIGDTWKTVFG